MAKEQKNDNLSKLYRQFSRQKYNKYKHQYPKMRESEIVSKIIHQWDAMDGQAKQKLKKQYENNKFLVKEDPSQSDSIKQSISKRKPEKQELENTEEKQTAVKSAEKQDTEKMSQSEKAIKYEISSIRSHFDSSFNETPKKTKAILKLGKRDYISFFKHYYADFHKEHPKWTSKQISEAVGLLWKKRKMQCKRVMVKHKETHPKTILKGRRLFRVEKKLTSQQVDLQWRLLPVQSKNLWENSKRITEERSHKIVGKMILKSVTPVQEKTFSFLSKVMQR